MFKHITVSSAIAGNRRFISNSYVEYKPMHSVDEILALQKYSFISSNQSIGIADFTKTLEQHEQMFNPAFHKNSQVRYGVTLKFLLDKPYSSADLALVSNEIIKRYKNLPYFSYCFQEGKGTYLLLYICERFFFPDGKKILQYAKKDRYRDKTTGRIARYSEENADNLVLVFRKGDVTKSDLVYFSSKETFFQFATTDVFEVTMNNLKKAFIALLEKLFSVETEEGYSLPTYALRKIGSYGRKKMALEWNNCIKTVSEKINNAIYALKITDCWDKSAQKLIYRLYDHYVEIIKTKHFVYDRWSFNIDFDAASHITVKNGISCFLDKFAYDLTRTMEHLIPVSFE